MSNTIDSKRILKEVHSGKIDALKRFHQAHPEDVVHWSSLRYEKTGDTILHVASRLGHLDIIEFLLENYTQSGVNCRNNDNKTALHEAAQFAQHKSAELLLQHGAGVDALKKADWTPLMLACTKIDNYETVKILLEYGASVNHENKDGWTALHVISREGDVRILNLLIRYDSDIRKLTKNGRSALNIAALHRKLEMVKRLIEIGLDVNHADGCGNTPLQDSILSEDLTIVQLILKSGAGSYGRNKTGFTILHLAASRGNLDVINYIISVLKNDVNIKTGSDLTPLHCAARSKRKEAYDFLLENGADVNIRDEFGRTASDYLDM